MVPLTIPGKFMLAILVFAVIVWITESVSYEVSSILIIGLIAVMVGFTTTTPAPTELDPNAVKAIGTTSAITMALSGFSNSAGHW